MYIQNSKVDEKSEPKGSYWMCSMIFVGYSKTAHRVAGILEKTSCIIKVFGAHYQPIQGQEWFCLVHLSLTLKLICPKLVLYILCFVIFHILNQGKKGDGQGKPAMCYWFHFKIQGNFELRSAFKDFSRGSLVFCKAWIWVFNPLVTKNLSNRIQVLNMAISTAIQHFEISYRHYSKKMYYFNKFRRFKLCNLHMAYDQSCVKKVGSLILLSSNVPLSSPTKLT